MDEGETKTCQNCKREVPAVNYTIHSVHCARNIRMCPVCKEPVPLAELEDHHEKLHKLLPCKQCGERVCGTDMEDHIRDSCAHTIKSCRFCDLELSRRELPLHEGYCGARTEQCADCNEWVMLKYRQLHLDSNHGFLRLDDDPVPVPKKEPVKITNTPKLGDWPKLPSTSNAFNRPGPSTSKVNNDRPLTNGYLKNINLIQDRPRTEIRYFNDPNRSGNPGPGSSGILNTNTHTSGGNINLKPLSKRNNNEQQINAAAAAEHKANKDLSSSRGAVKKRPAPKPPSASSTPASSLLSAATSSGSSPSKISSVAASTVFSNAGPSVFSPATSTAAPAIFSSGASKTAIRSTVLAPAGVPNEAPIAASRGTPTARDLAHRSALQRKQDEENHRREVNAYNLSVGLPPVLNPAEKLEKLRKMDALHNREVDDKDYKNRLQNRLFAPPQPENVGHVLGSSQKKHNNVPQDLEAERRKDDFKNLKPMTPEEFMNRFKELQVGRDSNRDAGEPSKERAERGDRFSEIKSSLKELRRGLNEVTAPYNMNQNSNNNVNINDRGNRWQQNVRNEREVRIADDDSDDEEEEEEEEAAGGVELQNVRLPCEFCGVPILAEDLVQHQTGCRPDLAQFRPPRRPSPPLDNARIEPVIPCEFCAESLPVYLISEHQERCGIEANLLFPD